eukprot:Gregarina_sp_Poly_1__5353@NODE_282_length_10089_cov_123_197964_g244_i0_p9_GENE_NODE_282_length_10089_cov_123_197964_g244_i0NODE_282_length_10089_cov_123_197964_g244_i0_p9_ORF_typecomplete_len107_score5_31DUF2682/PF10909_8/0_12_NODE_282_length_10089_cov_123_197964_g244_i014471767
MERYSSKISQLNGTKGPTVMSANATTPDRMLLLLALHVQQLYFNPKRNIFKNSCHEFLNIIFQCVPAIIHKYISVSKCPLLHLQSRVNAKSRIIRVTIFTSVPWQP